MKIANLALVVATSFASPASARSSMPAMLVGEWCFDGLENHTLEYTLPSWTDGGCKMILSIDPWGFTFDAAGVSTPCDADNTKSADEMAPSGTTHRARIVAKCWEGPPSPVLRTYVFERYKGRLTVTEVGL